MAKVSEKSTKTDIWAAYTQLLAAFEGKSAQTGGSFSELDALADALRTTQTELIAKFEQAATKLSALPEAYAEANAELGKRKAAVIESLEQDKKQLEAAITAARINWEQEKANHDMSLAREADEYSYNLAQTRRKEEDAYMEKAKVREAALTAREATLAEKEATIKDMTTEVNAFPAKLEAAVKTAREEYGAALKAEYEIMLKDVRQTAEHEKNILSLKLESLENTLSAQTKQLADTQRQLDAAQAQLKDMAVTVIQASKPVSGTGIA